MSVIIRLQGLPWTANALDVRRYFQGLTIPEGGVHIVGGELGDAFIAFSSDEDARQAMLMDGGRIKENKVKLLLSSRAEMQKVIEAARNRNLVMQGLLNPGTSLNPIVIGGGGGGGGGTSHGVSSAIGMQQPSMSVPGNNPMSTMPPLASMTDPAIQQMFLNRGIHSNQSKQSFQMQMSKSDMGLGSVGGGGGSGSVGPSDMRHVMMQIQQPLNVSNVQSSSGIVYEPTKKVGNGDRQDRDRRDRERERDRGKDDVGNGRRSDRSRSSRSPRRRSRERERERDRDLMRRDSYHDRDRGRDRRRSSSRSRSRDVSSSIDLADRSKFISPPDVFPLRGSMDTFSDGHPRDVDSRRGSILGNRGPEENVGLVNHPNGSSSRPSQSTGRSSGPTSMDEQQRRFEGRSDLPPTDRWTGSGDNIRREDEDNRQMENKRQLQQQDISKPWAVSQNMGDSDVAGRNVRPSGGGGGPFMANQTPQLPKSTCVIMRGIPFDTHPRSIEEFFSGLNIAPDGIRLLFDERGNRPHLAFIRFGNERDRDIVLKRQTQNFLDILVEVLPCSEEDFRRAPPLPQPPPPPLSSEVGPRDGMWSSSSSQPNRQGGGFDEETCIFLKGLPYRCTDKDIYQFFNDFCVVDAFIEYLRPNKSAGSGYAEFENPMEVRRALGLNGTKIDFRFIYLSAVTKEAMESARSHSNDNLNIGGGGGMRAPTEPLMNVDTTNNTGGFGRYDGGPQIQRNEDNRPPDCCLIVGLPFDANDHDILDFFAPVEVIPVAIHIMLDNLGCPLGDAFCEFANPQECHRALQKDGAALYPGSRFHLKIRSVSRGELKEALGLIPPAPPGLNGGGGGGELRSGPFNQQPPHQQMRGGGGGGGGGSGRSQHQDRPQRQRSPPLQQRRDEFRDNNREPGCILEVQNLPFRACNNDILHHFKGFGLTEDDIRRRYVNGMPSGEAKLVFRNAKDAQMCIRQMNRLPMNGRVLSMFLARDL